jgi:hypothetical protein
MHIYKRNYHIYIYVDDSFNNRQVIAPLNLLQYNHIIGYLCYIETEEDHKPIGYLVDIGTKELIRLHNFNMLKREKRFLSASTVTHGTIGG